MKTLEFTDAEIILFEKALAERISRKRNALKTLTKNNNAKAVQCEKDLNETEILYDKFLNIVPDKYMFGKRVKR